MMSHPPPAAVGSARRDRIVGLAGHRYCFASMTREKLNREPGRLRAENASADRARAVFMVLALACGCAQEKPASFPPTPAPAPAPQPATTSEPPPSNEKAAQLAAEGWLALVDAGNYPQSWTEAAAVFKGAIDQPGWAKAIGGTRGPLGKVVSRTVKSAKYATSLPGAPDGEYVVIKFDASFANKQSAVETVTPMKQPDGRWRVSGYFIR
jgi:hypothetical protein